jgi:multidrug efflux pump
MNWTESFIRRPVLSISLSLAILFFGIKALTGLAITEYPRTVNTQVVITTNYFGADPQTVSAFVTAPLEKAIGQAPGINYMTAISEEGLSLITVYMQMGQDPNGALTQIQSKVNSVLNQLPAGSQTPTLQELSGSGAYLMYLNYSGKDYTQQQITDYLTRVVQPAINSVKGIGLTSILPPGGGPNGNTFAMRVWLEPAKMAQFSISPEEVAQALKANDYVSAIGRLRASYFAVSLTADSALHTPDAFKNLIVGYRGSTPIYLRQVADVELGAQSYDSSVLLNGRPAVSIGVMAAPGSNALQVADGVVRVMTRLKADTPPGMKGFVLYNGADFVTSSIHEVLSNIIVALVIVIVVIFGFLGSFRALLVPTVAIPIAMLGVGSIMAALGFTINILTLLALVIAIGLVVDDSIIVVENVHRHIEHGLSPLDAALLSARELAAPIFVMAMTIVAVFAPLSLIGGLIGQLFKEFALTIVGTVLLSLVVAITFAPMISSRLLKSGEPGRIARAVDRFFAALRNAYGRLLRASLAFWPATIFGTILLTVCLVPLFDFSKSELAPPADQGIVYVNGIGPATATLEYMNAYGSYVTQSVFDKIKARQNSFIVNGVGIGGILLNNEMIGGLVLNPKRRHTTQQVRAKVQALTQDVPGLKLAAFGLPPLPGAAVGLPVQFVLTSAGSYKLLDRNADAILAQARKSGLFTYIDTDLQFDDRTDVIHINRDLAQSLGFTVQEISRNLETLLGGNYTNYYAADGLSYRVVPQVPPKLRADPDMLRDFYLRAQSGAMVPLSTFVTISSRITPDFLPQFQQLNSVTIEGSPAPGVALGEAIGFLQKASAGKLATGQHVDYAGVSRQFVHQGNAFVVTFAFALIVVFLVLSAQFESFRDALVVMTAVPVTLVGAVIPISLGISTINIYSEVGMILLIGLVSKQGILIVQFARSIQQEEGVDKPDALMKAAELRLRPILMTVAAMIAGSVPLVLATGAGAAARFSMGLVIICGLAFGSIVSLFVIPAFYIWFGAQLSAGNKLQRQVDGPAASAQLEHG